MCGYICVLLFFTLAAFRGRVVRDSFVQQRSWSTYLYSADLGAKDRAINKTDLVPALLKLRF